VGATEGKPKAEEKAPEPTPAPAPPPPAAEAKPAAAPSKKSSSPHITAQPSSAPSREGAPEGRPAKTPSSPHLPTAKSEEKHPTESESKTRRKAPTPFGKYSILREMGRGGKGVVHEALDTVLDRKVALKTIHSDSGIDPKEVEAEGRRFLAEARISASLPKHPHIVSV
jgi:hypothetical protein